MYHVQNCCPGGLPGPAGRPGIRGQRGPPGANGALDLHSAGTAADGVSLLDEDTPTHPLIKRVKGSSTISVVDEDTNLKLDSVGLVKSVTSYPHQSDYPLTVNDDPVNPKILGLASSGGTTITPQSTFLVIGSTKYAPGTNVSFTSAGDATAISASGLVQSVMSYTNPSDVPLTNNDDPLNPKILGLASSGGTTITPQSTYVVIGSTKYAAGTNVTFTSSGDATAINASSTEYVAGTNVTFTSSGGGATAINANPTAGGVMSIVVPGTSSDGKSLVVDGSTATPGIKRLIGEDGLVFTESPTSLTLGYAYDTSVAGELTTEGLLVFDVNTLALTFHRYGSMVTVSFQATVLPYTASGTGGSVFNVPSGYSRKYGGVLINFGAQTAASLTSNEFLQMSLNPTNVSWTGAMPSILRDQTVMFSFMYVI